MVVDLVLLPGLNNSAAVFDQVVSALPTKIRAHCPNLHALVTVEALAERVLADAPARFWLGGFSFGGYVAMAVLAKAPERVLGISLICSSPKADTEAQAERRRSAIAAAEKGDYEETAASSTVPFHPDSLKRPELLALRREIVQAYGVERYIAHCHACIARPDRTALLDGRRPTLLVTTSHDTVVPGAGVRSLAGQLPGSEFEQIEGAGHLLPLEQPQALATLLADWISRHAGPGHA
jgi:pimeloyl-ACP methyl ester carboxylesterase